MIVQGFRWKQITPYDGPDHVRHHCQTFKGLLMSMLTKACTDPVTIILPRPVPTLPSLIKYVICSCFILIEAILKYMEVISTVTLLAGDLETHHNKYTKATYNACLPYQKVF